MKPLLAHVYEPKRVTWPCYVQPKLNGIRALYQDGHFQSRDEIPFPEGLLDHLAKPLRELFDPSIILDGELYRHGWSLQRINAAVTPVRQQPTEDTGLVEYHVFDRVDYGLSFQDRIEMYGSGNVMLPLGIEDVLTKLVKSEAEADSYYAHWVACGYEGMMYRTGTCPYTLPKQPQVKTQSSRLKFLSDKDNRVWHLLKRKSWLDEDFLCTRVFEGEGKYHGTLGALECTINGGKMTWDMDRTFSVGSGLTDAERAKYWDHPELVIGHQVKVKYLCLSEAGIPLNPTVLAIL